MADVADRNQRVNKKDLTVNQKRLKLNSKGQKNLTAILLSRHGMHQVVERIAEESGLYRCVECGKCVAVCPMFEMYRNFSYEMSPRGIIKKALIDAVVDLLQDESIWYCTECDACTEICPEGVNFRDFMVNLRALAIQHGLQDKRAFCRECGHYFLPVQLIDYVRESLQVRDGVFLKLCPTCRRNRYSRNNT